MTVVSHDFEFVGGNLALDFVNTVHSGIDTFGSAGSVGSWAKAAGFRSVTGSRLTRHLTELRETLSRIAASLADGKAISRRDLEQLNDALERYPSRTVLRLANGVIERREVFDPANLDDLAGPLAAAAADLLTSPNRERVKRCPGCAMYFVDESRNRTRTWCSMKSCGNRAKVAAHYQRKFRNAEGGADPLA